MASRKSGCRLEPAEPEPISQTDLKQLLQKIENKFSNLETSFEKISADQTQTANRITAKLDQFLQNIENQMQVLENHVCALEVLSDKFTQEVKDEFQNLRVFIDNHVSSLKTSDLKPAQPVLDELKQSREDTAQLIAMMDSSCKDKWEVKEAKTMLPVALHFKMKKMTDKLSASLQNALTVETCIQLFQLASQLKLDDLWEAAKQMIVDNFKEVSETEDFCNLTLQELLIFVFCDDLQATEEHIFNGITRWILKDRKARRPLASELIPAVCFSRCTLKFLQDIQIHFLVNDHATVHEAVMHAISEKQSSRNQDKAMWRKTSVGHGHDVLFVIGGTDGVSCIETFDHCSKSWTSHNSSDYPSGRSTLAVTIGHFILVLEYYSKNTLRSYDPQLKEWKNLKPLPVNRSGLCAALEGKDLYVMCGEACLNRCDIYNFEQDSWSQTTNLTVNRNHPTSASLKGKIYCNGGEYNSKRLSCMEVYDSSTKKWSPTASMFSARSHHCLVSCSQYLWAVGGFNISSLNELERYDPEQNVWVKMAPMPTSRHGSSACFYEDQLYVIGGYGNKDLNTTEVYDCTKNEWTTCAPLNQARHYFAACVVKNLPNAEEYKGMIYAAGTVVCAVVRQYNLPPLPETVSIFPRKKYTDVQNISSPARHQQQVVENISSPASHQQQDVENISSPARHQPQDVENISSPPRHQQQAPKPEPSRVDTELKDQLKNIISGMADLRSVMQRTEERLIAVDAKLNRSLENIENRFSLLEFSVVKISGNQEHQQIVNQLQALEISVQTLDKSLEDLKANQPMQATADEIISLKSSMDDRVRKIETTLDYFKAERFEPGFENQLQNLSTSLEKTKQSVLDELKQSREDTAQLIAIMDSSCKDKWELEEAKIMLPVALRFNMKKMTKKMSEVLQNALTVKTCIQLFQLASKFELDSLWDASHQVILDNFKQVSEFERFCDLSLPELLVVIFCDNLCATEEHVYNAIAHWILKDRNTRRHLASELLPAVRFPNCTLKFLREIRMHYLVNDHTAIQSAVEKAIEVVKVKNSDGGKLKEKWRRKPETNDRGVLLVLGGYYCDSTIEAFDLENQLWVPHKNSKYPSDLTLAAVVGNVIYVTDTKKKLWAFDAVSSSWQDLQSLPLYRNGMCSAIEGEQFYLLGGEEATSRCDVYNIQQNSWKVINSLKVGRIFASSTEYEGKIYCSGGDLGNGSLTNSMEVYDPAKQLWTSSTAMSVQRSHHCLVSDDRYLWAVGGKNNSGSLNDLERYNPTQDSWATMAPMPTARYATASSFYNGMLYCMGGNGPLNPTEIYDPANNEWTKSTPLCRARSFFASCVMQGLTNAETYMKAASSN